MGAPPNVTLQYLKTCSWDKLYNHLQTGTYAITTDNIFSAYPDEDDVTYPMVIIYPPNTSVEKIGVGAYSSTIKQASITFRIEVFHNSAANVKEVADEVEHKIRTGMLILNGLGLSRIEFTDSDYDWWIEKGKVHRCTITIDAMFMAKSLT